MRAIFAVIIGFIIDVIIGDPTRLIHPAVVIGKMINKSEQVLRNKFRKSPGGEFIAGIIMCVSIFGITFAIPWVTLHYLYKINVVIGFALETFWCYQCIAVRDMLKESRGVYESIKTGDIEKERQAVGRIVGRDTDALDETGVIKACIESVAESFNDGVTAPILFLLIGGAPLGLAYKAVNTMDSMVGYKNERYLYFGRMAARLDDVCNYIPSRISGLLIIAASFICRENWRGAVRIWKRDRRMHASPNSGQTEAAMAGALGIRLGGPASYFGVVQDKPTIGDVRRNIEAEDILRANRIFLCSSIIGVIVLAVVSAVVRFGMAGIIK